MIGFSYRDRVLRLGATTAVTFFLSFVSGYSEGSAPIAFNRDIRPILSDNCFACHGPDKAERKADLRLDQPEQVVGDDPKDSVVVPGRPNESELYRRITHHDADERMPPEESGKALSPGEVDRIRRWIEEGAPWEEHWAYQPIRRPKVPETGSDWPANAIDAFLWTRMQEEGVEPSSDAARHVLIRRLSFDLRGLPPTRSEVDAFLADNSHEAYVKLVERFLSSPHFGERMAIPWLDWVRYADTVGYHGDQSVSVWPYRDYVIDSFNQNKPFDQFTLEQLAGDLLKDPNRRQRIASGYNRLNRKTAEGGAQAKEYLAKYAADRVRTTSTVWMGATLGCAECHDHKYDPYTAEDFYSFSAFFADLREEGVYNRPGRGGGWGPEVMVPDEAQEAALAELRERIEGLEETLETPTEALREAQAVWEAELREAKASGRLGWRPFAISRVESEGGAKLKRLDDASVLNDGKNPENDTYVIEGKVDRERVTALRLEALPHSSLDNESLSRGGGNFILTDVDIAVASEDDPPWREVAIRSARADYSQSDYPIESAIDDDPESGWAVDGHQEAKPRRAVFELSEPLGRDEPQRLRIRLSHNSEFDHHNIGRFRLSAISMARPTVGDAGVPEEIAEAITVPPEERGDEMKEAVGRYYRSIAPSLDPVRDELADARERRDALVDEIPRSLVSESVEPREIRVLPRGNWMDDSGKVVAPSVPHFLPPLASDNGRATRADLARWLVSDTNPLTARVIMNRFWALFFGEGLSRTQDDFGAQGEPPSHPELLDWLASEFIDTGWDMKAMIRKIVMSRAYRQSSVASDTLKAADPFNRLYARQARFRLPAELIRDNALAISGLLADGLGGPSVKPYQPEGYYAQLNFPKRSYQEDRGTDQYRRGVYTHWQRTFLHPSFKAFDAPSREECTVQREPSNTPLQALALLNDPTYVEAARFLGSRLTQDVDGAFGEKLQWLYRRALGRDPRPDEHRELQGLFERHREHYRESPEEAKELFSVGQQPPPKGIDLGEAAAWTSVSRTVLNLHETIVRP